MMIHNRKPEEDFNLIMLEVAANCNASCDYCPQGRGLVKAEGQRLITQEILEKAIYFASKGKQKIIFLHHRGEPLIHPEIDQIVKYVRSAGFLVCFSTNLSLADEKLLKKIIKSGVNQLEIHFSAGLTVRSFDFMICRLKELITLNQKIRKNGCRILVNYALKQNEKAKDVVRNMKRHIKLNNRLVYNMYHPHDWPSLYKVIPKNVQYQDCAWYKTRSYGVYCNGDVVICCLDQFGYSKRVNIMDIDYMKLYYLMKRKICSGCTQQDWFDSWISQEILEVPEYLADQA